MSQRTRSSRYWRVDDLRDLDLLAASYVQRSSSRHVHEGYEIAVIEAGRVEVRTRGATHVAGPGSIIVINPGDAHVERVRDASGWSMRAFYPRIDDMRDAVVDGSSRGGTPFFATTLIEDPALTRVIRALHHTLERPSTSMERETQSILAASMLVLRHGRGRSVSTRTSSNAAAVRRAVDFIEASYAGNISLANLAAMTQLSGFHLVRLFNDSLGMPPHVFQTNVRLRHARAFLERGLSPARVAAQTGFTDQSHLNRHFVRAFGITPGQFASATRTYNQGERARP